MTEAGTGTGRAGQASSWRTRSVCAPCGGCRRRRLLCDAAADDPPGPGHDGAWPGREVEASWERLESGLLIVDEMVYYAHVDGDANDVHWMF